MVHRAEPFTAEELSYLSSLPAVESVRSGRIRYSSVFKRECMRRYLAGESPARIFSEAGLPSSLIGYKRIERAISRWRQIASESGVNSPSDGERLSDGQWEEMFRRREEAAMIFRYGPRARAVGRAGDHDRDGDGRRDGDGSPDGPLDGSFDGSEASSSLRSAEIADTLIVQQAHYIADLEARIRSLEAQVAELKEQLAAQ
ncbi:hypothetical protein [Bifidobacterium simiarum]|uniref:hypothetical protein n=1 Tax=Bifidobacterium simiarum TaxID=2045441 RepID=UPI001BDCB554|nr:hypothetical protein [Bifidobacterium simiarum]